MRRFFFHLGSETGIERDDVGILCEDVECAYLQACAAIPDMTAALMRERRDPMEHCLLITNDAGDLMMRVPFTELIRPTAIPSGKREPLYGPETRLERLRRNVRDGSECLRRQGEMVTRLRRKGRDTTLSEQLYEQFEQILAQYRLQLEAAMLEPASVESDKRPRTA